MWMLLLFNASLFYVVSYFGTKNHVHALTLAGLFAIVHHFASKYIRRESFDYMPDSHKTTCAKGSVPAGNGLDCKLPTDIYGL